MEYQKIINLLYTVTNQLSKFRTKNWVEMNDESRGTYKIGIQIRFKTSMLKPSLCDYSDIYILVSWTRETKFAIIDAKLYNIIEQ